MSWGLPGLGEDLTLCREHAVEVWMAVQRFRDETVRTDSPELNAAVRDVEEAHKSAGDIYFAMVNGLIKVGWSSQLWKRLHSYGPDAVLLCSYPGSRADERDLHKTLAPFRAAGREWYSDCDFIRGMVADATGRHGKPSVDPGWTRPKAAPLRVKAYRG